MTIVQRIMTSGTVLGLIIMVSGCTPPRGREILHERSIIPSAGISLMLPPGWTPAPDAMFKNYAQSLASAKQRGVYTVVPKAAFIATNGASCLVAVLSNAPPESDAASIYLSQFERRSSDTGRVRTGAYMLNGFRVWYIRMLSSTVLTYKMICMKGALAVQIDYIVPAGLAEELGPMITASAATVAPIR